MTGTTKTLTANYVLNADGVKAGVTQADTHLSGLGGALSKMQGVATGAFGAFSKVASEVGGEIAGPLMSSVSGVGEAVKGLGERFAQLGESGGGSVQKMGALMAGIGATTAGLGAGLEALGTPMEAARKQLETAITDAGGSFDEFKGKVGSTDKQMQNLGIRNQETEKALATLTMGLHDPAKALGEMGMAADVAAAKHISLSAAADLLVKAHGGSTKVFKQFGIDLTTMGASAKDLKKSYDDLQKSADAQDAAQKKLNDLSEIQHSKAKLTEADHIALRNAEEKLVETKANHAAAQDYVNRLQDQAKNGTDQLSNAMNELGSRVKGQAAASVDTFGGKLDILKTKLLDGAATLGQKYGPAMMGLGATSTIVGGLVDGAGGIIKHFTTATEAATVATDAMAASEDAAGASSMVALGPLGLIIVAIVAVGVAVYEVYKHWGAISDWFKGVWKDVKDIFSDAVDFVKHHMDDFIAILLGPIGAIYELYKHWDEVWGLIKQVPRLAFEGIKAAVSLGIDALRFEFVTLPQKVLGWLGDAGSWLLDAGHKIISGLLRGITEKFDDVKHALSNLTNLLPSWKGPADKDASLLYGAGQLVIGGFAKGIRDSHGAVRSALGDVTGLVGGFGSPALTSGLSGGSSAGGATVINIGGVTVHGSVMSDRDLGDAVYQALLQKRQRVGNLLLG